MCSSVVPPKTLGGMFVDCCGHKQRSWTEESAFRLTNWWQIEIIIVCRSTYLIDSLRWMRIQHTHSNGTRPPQNARIITENLLIKALWNYGWDNLEVLSERPENFRRHQFLAFFSGFYSLISRQQKNSLSSVLSRFSKLVNISRCSVRQLNFPSPSISLLMRRNNS